MPDTPTDTDAPVEDATVVEETTDDDVIDDASEGDRDADPSFIELSDNVVDEIMRRQEEQQEIIQEANQTAQEFQQLRQKAEQKVNSNDEFMNGVASIYDIDIEDYVFDQNRGGLRELTEQEKAQLEAQRQQQQNQQVGPPVSTDMDTEEAVLYIRENGPENIVVPEDEDRVLVHEAIQQAQSD